MSLPSAISARAYPYRPREAMHHPPCVVTRTSVLSTHNHPAAWVHTHDQPVAKGHTYTCEPDLGPRASSHEWPVQRQALMYCPQSGWSVEHAPPPVGCVIATTAQPLKLGNSAA